MATKRLGKRAAKTIAMSWIADLAASARNGEALAVALNDTAYTCAEDYTDIDMRNIDALADAVLEIVEQMRRDVTNREHKGMI